MSNIVLLESLIKQQFINIIQIKFHEVLYQKNRYVIAKMFDVFYNTYVEPLNSCPSASIIMKNNHQLRCFNDVTYGAHEIR